MPSNLETYDEILRLLETIGGAPDLPEVRTLVELETRMVQSKSTPEEERRYFDLRHQLRRDPRWLVWEFAGKLGALKLVEGTLPDHYVHIELNRRT